MTCKNYCTDCNCSHDDLVARLRDLIPSGYGHNSDYAHTLSDAADALERQSARSRATTMRREMTFDEWQASPYTKVLQDSIANDYVPKHDTPALMDSDQQYALMEAYEISSEQDYYDARPNAMQTIQFREAFYRGWKAASELPQSAPQNIPNNIPASAEPEYPTMHDDVKALAKMHEEFLQMNTGDARSIACVKALEGLSDDALAGGWNYRDMDAYAKGLEVDAKRYRFLRDESENETFGVYVRDGMDQQWLSGIRLMNLFI